MTTLLLALAAGYGLFLATWTLFLAAMCLKRALPGLGTFAKVNGYIILAVGLPLDALFNLAASLVFLELPHELLFSSRVNRLERGSGWRAKLAHWFCERLLKIADPDHC